MLYLHPALVPALMCLVCIGLGGGCQSTTRALGFGSEVTALGDWNDVDPAVDVAVSRVDMAVLHRPDTAPDALERTYRLRTVTDEPVALTVSRAFPTGGGAPGHLRLHAQVGRFGDSEREGRLLAAVKTRLEQLAGVDYAPMR